MILVTGAAGKTGRAVIRALATKKQTVRALVRREEQIARVRALGAAGATVGDMRDETVMRQACLGVCAVYHICPNIHPDEIVIGKVSITAAMAAGVQHFVFHSVLRPQIEAMPHHWRKMRVEEALFESGLPFTVLQPASYMQNLFAIWDGILERGVLAAPYSVQSQSSPVDLQDVAVTAAIVLCEPGHHGAIYELCGPDILTQSEQAAIISTHVGHAVRAQQTELDAWAWRARANGLSEYALETLRKMFRYYDQHGFWGNSHTLHVLLGRQPTSYAAFVKRVLHEKTQLRAR